MAWFPLGAAFRICDPGTRFGDGFGNWDVDNTGPRYDALVPDVYHEGHEMEVQRQTLSLVDLPRWFQTAPLPRTLEEIPLADQGASLSLAVTPATNGLWHFSLRVRTTSRDLWREVEHRRTNVTPFLFSFCADGTAVFTNASAGEMGGMTGMKKLARKGSAYQSDLTVDPRSILALVPGGTATELSVVAAFSESQHHDTGIVVMLQKLKQRWSPRSPQGFQGPPICIRSNTVRLRHVHDTWQVIENR